MRPVAENFPTAAALWFAEGGAGGSTITDALDARVRQNRLNLALFTAHRRAKSEKAHAKFPQEQGVLKQQQELEVGNIVLRLNHMAGRKAKAQFASNYRFQLFKVSALSGSRVYLRAAVGDSAIRFKLPVHRRKVRVVNEGYGGDLEFPAVNHSIGGRLMGS